MPPHHHKHMDKWWSELPDKAKDAATFLGWNQDTWDSDDYDQVEYYQTPLSQLSEKKKAAALYLGWEPLQSKQFCEDPWWSEAEPETRKHAELLGYDEHKWDDDWKLHHLPIEDKYWNELSEEERVGARYFGYTPATWDQVEDDPDVPFYEGHQTVDPPAPPASDVVEEKKEGDEVEEEELVSDEEEWSVASEEEEEEEEQEEDIKVAAAAAAPSKPQKKKQDAPKKKKRVKNSRVFGAKDSGKRFATGNVRRISKLVVYADSHVVKGIEFFGARHAAVGTKDDKKHEFELGRNEFIVSAEVRASNKSIQSLKFRTNKGRDFGPIGGKGYLLGKDRAGDVHKIGAPFKYQLAGFMGTADDSHVTSLAMAWGPVPPFTKK